MNRRQNPKPPGQSISGREGVGLEEACLGENLAQTEALNGPRFLAGRQAAEAVRRRATNEGGAYRRGFWWAVIGVIVLFAMAGFCLALAE